MRRESRSGSESQESGSDLAFEETIEPSGDAPEWKGLLSMDSPHPSPVGGLREAN